VAALADIAKDIAKTAAIVDISNFFMFVSPSIPNNFENRQVQPDIFRSRAASTAQQ
jgi:hypothetical protein